MSAPTPVLQADVSRYRKISKQVAHCIMRGVAGDIDVMSMGRDDYEHELFTHAWELLIKWRGDESKRQQGPQGEQRYIYKCLWNQARSFERARLVTYRCLPTVELTDTYDGFDLDFEERAIARQTLRILRTRLPAGDWRILCQIAMAEGDRFKSSRNDQRKKAHAKKEAYRLSQFLDSSVNRIEAPMRRALEREASILGIVWMPETTDAELEKLITERKERGHMTEVSQQQSPPCYGLYWEAIPGTDSCMGCAVNKSCLQRFVVDRLPLLRSQCGDDLHALSVASEVKPEALLVAINHEKNTTKSSSPGSGGNGDSDISQAWDSGDGESVDEEAPIPQAEPEEMVGIRVEEEPEEPQVKARASKKKAPIKEKKTKGKKAKKKKVSKKKAASVRNPQSAGPAKRAKVLASKKTTHAVTAKAQALVTRVPRQKESRREKHHRQWFRERERHPDLAVVSPGCTLMGIHRGKPWEVKVFRGRYMYQYQDYGTLQSVCNAITGLVTYPKQRTISGKEQSRPVGERKMSNWSAKRFFQKAITELSGK